MGSEIAKELANNNHALVVAPAGCGKTYTIAESVAHSDGRQLILTHTHAGVRAMINHLRNHKISPKKYRISTIHSFALKYAAAFPTLSSWSNSLPSNEEWNQVCSASCKAIKNKTVKKIITNSYNGIYVDEYQDCSTDQHELILLLADYLPCRIVGDPLQAIFGKINGDKALNWSVVLKHFNIIAELNTPWRWKNDNSQLGDWLLSVRKKLLNEDNIDFSAAPINWVQNTDRVSQINTCYRAIRNKNESTVVIRKWPNQCHNLARYLKNTYCSMETVECEDLIKWTKKFEDLLGADRTIALIDFTKICISNLPQFINILKERISHGQKYNPRKQVYKNVVDAFRKIVISDDLSLILIAMDSIDNVNVSLVYARRELWRDMKKTLKQKLIKRENRLSDIAWNIRDAGRKIGRRIDKRTISTTLLIKGLEFDNTIILNVNELDSAENLYVAMTRGSKSLTVLSENPSIHAELPDHLKQTDS